MADVGPAGSVDPVQEGRQKDAELAETEAALAARNPHGIDMNLPPALMDDGGLGS
jgi:hypothetical protein